MAVPAGLAAYIASKGNGAKADNQDPAGSKVDANPFLKAAQKKKSGGTVSKQAQQGAVQRKLASMKKK